MKIRSLKFLIYCFLFSGIFISTLIGIEHLLDDTFIHLRFAKNFIATGQIFYNQGQPSFGTSSLFYLFIISTILRFFSENNWPIILKIFSILIYLFSFLLLLRFINIKKLYEKERFELFISISFLFLLYCVPSTTRWLQDGMETSLAVFFTLLSFYSIIQYDQNKNIFTNVPFLSLTLVLPAIIRIDLLPIVFSNIIFVFILNGNKSLSSFFKITGFLIIYLTIWIFVQLFIFQSIIPDSALAKNLGRTDLFWIIYFIKSTLAISPLWLGSLFLGLFLLIFLHKKNKKSQILLLVGFIPVLAQIVGGTISGQVIHGVRYFLPTIMYLICTILFLLVKNDFFKEYPLLNRNITYGLVILLIVSIVHIPLSWHPLNNVLKKSFISIPPQLKSKDITICAADIGQIGWYTNSKIFDLSALVNGREIASTPVNARLEKLLTKMGLPDYLILKQEDLNDLKMHSGEIVLKVDSRFKNYIKTNYIIMKLNNLNRELIWNLWTPD